MTKGQVSKREMLNRGSGAHIALLIMKMLRRPVRPEELAEVSPTKLNSDHRRKYLDRLMKLGYIVQTSAKPETYMITRSGLDQVYMMAGKSVDD